MMPISSEALVRTITLGRGGLVHELARVLAPRDEIPERWETACGLTAPATWWIEVRLVSVDCPNCGRKS